MVFTGQFVQAVDLAKTTFGNFTNGVKTGFTAIGGTIKTNVLGFVQDTISGFNTMVKSASDSSNKIVAISNSQTNAETNNENKKQTLREVIAQMRKQTEQNSAQAILGIGQNLTSLMQSQSAEAFAIGKAAAIAQATINTYLAATAAFAALAGIYIVGPTLGAIAAAAAIAAGLVNVGNIARQQMPRAEIGAYIPGTPGGTPVIVGENNKPEIIQPLDAATRSSQGLGGLGGGNVFNINLNGPTYADEKLPVKLVRQIDRALEDYRLQGNSAFAFGLTASL
jgi:hypothetical protein